MTAPSVRRTRRQRGSIEELPSGALRVSVYAGADPLTGRRHYLRESISAGPSAHAEAQKAMRRLATQAWVHESDQRAATSLFARLPARPDAAARRAGDGDVVYTRIAAELSARIASGELLSARSIPHTSSSPSSTASRLARPIG